MIRRRLRASRTIVLTERIEQITHLRDCANSPIHATTSTCWRPQPPWGTTANFYRGINLPPGRVSLWVRRE